MVADRLWCGKSFFIDKTYFILDIFSELCRMITTLYNDLFQFCIHNFLFFFKEKLTCFDKKNVYQNLCLYTFQLLWDLKLSNQTIDEYEKVDNSLWLLIVHEIGIWFIFHCFLLFTRIEGTVTTWYVLSQLNYIAYKLLCHQEVKMSNWIQFCTPKTTSFK